MELGCGPALHTIGLARSGVPSCTGIDVNDHMLQYARWRYEQDQSAGAGGSGVKSDKAIKGFAAPKPSSASSASQPLELIKADMATFDLKDRQGSYDMVMCLLGTFSHMLDNDRYRPSDALPYLFFCIGMPLRMDDISTYVPHHFLQPVL